MHQMQLIDESVVRATAQILGPNSGAAKAIEDAEKRRKAGLEVTFYRQANTIIVASRALH